jgi:tetratricopeptide (TPR) repeat protein/cold shock CspA family protein
VSRVHGITFEQFKDQLFQPLEHVVQVQQLSWGDYAYAARHSEIAEIVFEQVLTEPTDRFNVFIRIIRALNPIYSVDLEALRLMLRAKSVHELFPKFEDANAIYSAAMEVLGEDAYLLQQNANHERVRPNGNLERAQLLLEKARDLDPTDSTIVHTLAEVIRAKAESAEKPLERARLRKEAAALLRSILSNAPSAHYATVTRLKLAIDQVRDILYDTASTDRAIDEAIRDSERTLEAAKQRFPGDHFVLSAEAELAKVLQDHERSFNALKRARDANPRDPFIVSRLVTLLLSRGEAEKAITYTKEALESNRGDKRLNHQYAELLRQNGKASSEELAYYYRRAFSRWDDNFESQFWYSRYAFESQKDDDVRDSKEVFRHLRDVPLSHSERTRTRDAIGGLNSAKRFTGTVMRLEASHGFVIVDGRGEVVFFHEMDVAEGVWSQLVSNKRVTFSIGFSLRGPKAFGITLEGDAT